MIQSGKLSPAVSLLLLKSDKKNLNLGNGLITDGKNRQPFLKGSR